MRAGLPFFSALGISVTAITKMPHMWKFYLLTFTVYKILPDYRRSVEWIHFHPMGTDPKKSYHHQIQSIYNKRKIFIQLNDTFTNRLK